MAMEEQDNVLKILVKFPTRERPQKFEKVIKQYNMYAADKEHISYLVSLDRNDPKLQQYVDIIGNLKQNIKAVIADSDGKISAVNRDMDNAPDWDILVLASDDMICQKVGWDNILRDEMTKYYPELDGILWHNDGFTQQKLNTMCILGKKRYKKFDYIYHPDYKSLWCDNEFMEVGNLDNRQTYFNEVLFKHEHYSNGQQFKNTKDDLLVRNEKLFFIDKKTFEERKQKGFPIK